MEIGIDVDPGVVACFCGVVGVLHDVTSDEGRIGQRFICREEACIGAKFREQHVGNAEAQI